MEQDNFTCNHYAFRVNDAQFDEIFGRVIEEGLVYGAGHQIIDDGNIKRLLRLAEVLVKRANPTIKFPGSRMSQLQ